MAIRLKIGGIDVEADNPADAAELIRTLGKTGEVAPPPRRSKSQSAADEGWTVSKAGKVVATLPKPSLEALRVLVSEDRLTTRELAARLKMADLRGLAGIFSALKNRAKDVGLGVPYSVKRGRNGQGRVAVIHLNEDFRRVVSEVVNE